MKNIPNKDKDEDVTNNHIGTTASIYIRGFNGDNPLDGKIDTGAEMCSLDAQGMEVYTDDVTNNSIVTFSYNEYRYKMNVEGFQSVSSADGGVVNRPYVLLDVTINDQVIRDVIFNLNDRSNMDYAVLIGMNLIQAAKLVIDPSLKEMEISFGPEGMSVDNSLPVDNNVEKVDTIASTNESLLSQYLSSMSDKSIEDIVVDVISNWKELNAKQRTE